MTDPATMNVIYMHSGFNFLSVLPSITYSNVIYQMSPKDEVIFDATMGGQQLDNILKISYSLDPIAKSVLDKRPLSYSYTMGPRGLIHFHDQNGFVRLYIPNTAECKPSKPHTEFPIEGEKVREKCSLREELIRDIHSNGHLGRGKTLEQLTRYYFWPGMTRDVVSYIRGCKACQQNKALSHKRYGMIQPLQVPGRRWATVTMDFITDLPRTATGYDRIFVIVDKYSKRIHLIPCKSTYTAKQYAELFYNEIYRHHGMPIKMVSDRDKTFVS